MYDKCWNNKKNDSEYRARYEPILQKTVSTSCKINYGKLKVRSINDPVGK